MKNIKLLDNLKTREKHIILIRFDIKMSLTLGKISTRYDQKMTQINQTRTLLKKQAHYIREKFVTERQSDAHT